jgi:pyruvate/2-oxoglutarate dehydrogenase complex dihydrolipoamide dehydrogenase (E3) component
MLVGVRIEGLTETADAVTLTYRGPGVYAVGDVTTKLMLAHVAEAQGIIAAETIAGAATLSVSD